MADELPTVMQLLEKAGPAAIGFAVFVVVSIPFWIKVLSPAIKDRRDDRNKRFREERDERQDRLSSEQSESRARREYETTEAKARRDLERENINAQIRIAELRAQETGSVERTATLCTNLAGTLGQLIHASQAMYTEARDIIHGTRNLKQASTALDAPKEKDQPR